MTSTSRCQTALHRRDPPLQPLAARTSNVGEAELERVGSPQSCRGAHGRGPYQSQLEDPRMGRAELNAAPPKQWRDHYEIASNRRARSGTGRARYGPVA